MQTMPPGAASPSCIFGAGFGFFFFGLKGFMPSRASSSALSFSAWPAWPFTQCQRTSWRVRAASSACHNSAFLTGCLAAVFQPFFFQPAIQPRIPSRK
jgi:hypothetical protein